MDRSRIAVEEGSRAEGVLRYSASDRANQIINFGDSEIDRAGIEREGKGKGREGDRYVSREIRDGMIKMTGWGYSE